MSRVIIGIIIITITFFIFMVRKEKYSQGALVQLYAKGPQDAYLTGDAWKYIPPWYYDFGWRTGFPVWNMPTRGPYNGYFYPYYYY